MTLPAVSTPAPAPDGVYYRACNLCEAICGLTLTVLSGEVTDVRGDPLDPLSQGHICPKGAALPDLHRDPDRLKRPLRRVGTASTGFGWTEIGWDEALEIVAAELARVCEQHGPDAVATYQGNPSVHNSGTLLSAGGFLGGLETRNRYSATSVDQLPHHRAALEMLGHPLLMPIADVDRTDFLLILGANPAASNGSILTAPGITRRLKNIVQRGGRVVLLDPRRSESADYAEHHFIRPGTDAALLLALLHVIFDEKLERLERLSTFSDGLEDLQAAALPYSPERVATVTGLDASFIRRLAREFAAAPSAVAYGRVGLSTQMFGGLCQWLLNALNAVTGNLDRVGGAMFPRPAFDLLARAKKGERPLGRFASRVRGLPEFGGELPSAALAEEMDTPGPGQVKAFVCIAGNPVLSTPDGTRLDRALEGLDFMVAIDPYLNETTRHAHIILPPATGLETEHYDVIFHHFAVRNTARLNSPIFPISEDQRHDWQIFEGLRERLTGKAGSDPAARLALGLKHGPYKLSLDDLKAALHGLDFGPMTPCLPERLLTGNGRLNLAPPALIADLPRLEAMLAAPTPATVLIGRRQLRSNNSWMHNTPRLMRGPDRCTLMLHPHDADRLGIVNGELLSVSSRVGRVTVPAEVTGTLMPGVVSLPHGFGHGRTGTRLGVAAEHPGVSYNDLADPELIDELTGNAAVNGIPVEIRAVEIRAVEIRKVEQAALSAD